MGTRGILAGARVCIVALAGVGASLSVVAIAQGFPWSTDMYRGPQVATFAVAPRTMPDGVLPIDGIHYNTHFGQPPDMPGESALPPMSLHDMTLGLRNPLSPTLANLARGRERFETNCAPCHGMSGEGNGTIAHLLVQKPANLMTGIVRVLPDGYVYGYIRNGSLAMPSYDAAMSSAERWEVVLYLRDLQRRHRELGPLFLRHRGLGGRGHAAPEALGPHRKATDADSAYTEPGSDSP